MHVYAQTKIERKVFEIIDTTQNKTEQTRLIYNWITKHITLDIQAQLNGKSNNKTIDDILKSKKATSSDFAFLFNEMCKVVGIESYTVLGYAKNFLFIKGSEFYRANQIWNVVHIDSTWILVDVAWGSGYVMRQGTMLQKLLFYFFNKKYLPTKFVFMHQPDKGYFNAEPSAFARTHLPIDPKWQFLPRVFNIRVFENDTVDINGIPNVYKPEIEKIKDMSINWQRYVEGCNGLEFNNYNNFNIAEGYLFRAMYFDDIKTTVNFNNISLFEDNLRYYNKAKYHIEQYKSDYTKAISLRLNFVKDEKKSIPVVNRFINKEYNPVKVNPTFNQSAASKNEKFKILLNKENESLSHLINFIPHSKNVDTLAFSEVKQLSNVMKIDSLLKLLNQNCLEIDSLHKLIKQKEPRLCYLNNSFLEAKTAFAENMNVFEKHIYTFNSKLIFQEWNKFLYLKDSMLQLSHYKRNTIDSVQYFYAKALNIHIDNRNICGSLDKLNIEIFKCRHDTLFEEKIFSIIASFYLSSNKLSLNVVADFEQFTNNEKEFIAERNKIASILNRKDYDVTIGLFSDYVNDLLYYHNLANMVEKKAIRRVENEANKSILRVTQKMETFNIQNTKTIN